MNYTFTIDNFECWLSKTDEQLTITAEDLSSGNKFSKSLNNDEAKAASQDNIFDINTIYQVLKDYSESKSDKVSLSITADGKLTYNCQVLIGSVSKQFGFTLDLEKEDEEPLSKMEKMVGKLLTRVSELEKSAKSKEESIRRSEFEIISKANDERFNKFEKIFFEKLERIEDLLVKTGKRVEMLEKLKKTDDNKSKDSNLQVQYRFSPNAQFANKYNLSNENRTAIANTPDNYSIFGDTPLPRSGKPKISFLIEHIAGSGLGVGISNRNAILKAAAFNEKGSVMYFGGQQTYFYTDGFCKENILPGLKKGDIVSFIVDMHTGEVILTLNDSQVGTHTFKKADLESNEFFPFMHCQGIDNGTTFI